MIEQTFERTFVLERQSTQQTQIIKKRISMTEGVVNLTDVLEGVGDLSTCIFKIYDFNDNKYHPIRQYFQNDNLPFAVPYRLVQSEIVLIKYFLDSTQTASVNSGVMSSSDASSLKKQRSKQRTVGEVIQLVKQWRQMHTNPINGVKLNLQQAAEVIGISKKSLDDYYYQLRLGEKYDFDFMSNINQKVGVLRTFIKNYKPKTKSLKGKIQKHPKKLKIIDQMQGQDVRSVGKRRVERKSRMSEEENMNKRQQQPIYQSNFNQNSYDNLNFLKNSQIEPMDEEQRDQNKSIKSIENEFYRNFEFSGADPIDPFLNFQCDFKKKNLDDNQMSDQILF